MNGRKRTSEDRPAEPGRIRFAVRRAEIPKPTAVRGAGQPYALHLSDTECFGPWAEGHDPGPEKT